MKSTSLSKNFFFQVSYKLLILLFPLIVSPYLTRTLGDNGLGIYTFVNSVAYFFVIFAMLGISMYGQRIIAQSAEDPIRLRKAFWSLFILHIIISLCFAILYLVFILFFVSSDYAIYLIEGLYVLSALFDITWLYYGLEDFKSVIVINILVKIAEGASIFVFVRSPDDLWKYTLITAGGLLLGQVLLWPRAIKSVKAIRFERRELLSHIKPLLYLFITVLATSLYTIFDKTLLGIMSSKENVAYYEYSNRIVSIPKTVIAALGTVMYPKACKLVKEGNVLLHKKVISVTSKLTIICSFFSIAGLCSIASLFATLYYGKSFQACGPITMALTPIIFLVGYGDIVRLQVMVPYEMDKEYIISTILNAIVNIALTIILIPVIGVFGAVIGTISAEFLGLAFQIFICRKKHSFLKDLIYGIPFVLQGGILFLTVVLSGNFLPETIWGLVLRVLIGAVVSLGLLSIFLKVFDEGLLHQIRDIFHNSLDSADAPEKDVP